MGAVGTQFPTGGFAIIRKGILYHIPIRYIDYSVLSTLVSLFTGYILAKRLIISDCWWGYFFLFLFIRGLFDTFV